MRFVEAPYDDTWLRDSGPISLREGAGFRLLDFRFTGWGGKFDASQDDLLVERLHEAGTFLNSARQSIDFALEGGAIETDGAGTLLSTWQCLHERHPEVSREELTAKLAGWLQQDRVLWLDHGYLEGDDTDAHIDTLARFAGPDAIVFQGCDDPGDSHYAELQAMADELAALTHARWPALSPVPAAVGAADHRRGPAPGGELCELPDRQWRGADARLRRRRRRQRARPCWPKPSPIARSCRYRAAR